MESIAQGMQGPAVEDVQTRLTSLGYTIDEAETSAKEFGTTSAAAVRAFRASQGLEPGDEVDGVAWSALVDASYKLGDRTLYLRLPNFHGADVRALQRALNTLGFACGVDDGYFGPHTEAALQQFQENVGLFADGMAFQDTFAYINRLHHVWEGKPSVIDVEAEARERDLQKAIIGVKGRYGKNALVMGRSLRPEATGRERNEQVGGHHV